MTQRASPPNLVVILADDLGFGDVGFDGRREWATPHLDRLAAEGTRFTRWYAGAPVCAPSRAVLLTGRYTLHHGVRKNGDDLPAGETTLAEALRARGYATALVGKWHGGAGAAPSHPLDHGFDAFFGFTRALGVGEHYPSTLWEGRAPVPVSGYDATLYADRAIRFIAAHRERPFFLFLSLPQPHFQIEAPAADVARLAGRFPEADPARPVRATYAAMIERMDAEIGRVLAALADAGLERDTLVVFTSDNGATFEPGNQGASRFHESNRPLRGGKRSLYEGGIRVPAVVRWPAQVPAGRESDAIVHGIDLLPTLLAAAGGRPDPAWRVDGADLLAVWQGRGTPRARVVFWEWQAEGAHELAALRGDRKLLVPSEGPAELYDLATDPAERRPLPFDRAGQALSQALSAWLASAGSHASQ